MCIEKVLSFRFAGKLYEDERAAVHAALHEIGARILKDYSSDPLKGLLEHGEHISSLRARYLELSAAGTPTLELVQEAPGEPMLRPRGVPLYDDITGTVREKTGG